MRPGRLQPPARAGGQGCQRDPGKKRAMPVKSLTSQPAARLGAHREIGVGRQIIWRGAMLRAFVDGTLRDQQEGDEAQASRGQSKTLECRT